MRVLAGGGGEKRRESQNFNEALQLFGDVSPSRFCRSCSTYFEIRCQSPAPCESFIMLLMGNLIELMSG